MVNIFATNSDPVVSATDLDDKRTFRMLEESYELMSYAIHRLGPKFADIAKKVYQPGRHNGHTAIDWVAKDRVHFGWLLAHADALHDAYHQRYPGKPNHKTHAKFYRIMVQVYQRMDSKISAKVALDGSFFEHLEFGGWFNHNAFRYEAVKRNEGKVELKPSVGIHKRIQLSMLHKWFYADARDTTWKNSVPPLWAYDPAMRRWCVRVFGNPVNDPAALRPKSPEYYDAIAVEHESTFDLDQLALRLADRFRLNHSAAAAGDTTSSVLFSTHYTHRVFLARQWNKYKPPLIVFMLNPSIADAHKNDPTVQRVENRARAAGFGGYIILNLFSLRSTDPKGLLNHPEPVGRHANEIMRRVILDVERMWARRPFVLIAHGITMFRDNIFQSQMRYVINITQHCKRLCLGTTSNGYGKHPLYVPYDQPFETYKPRKR